MEAKPATEPPLVTIGMPTYNREWSLPKVLESMYRLDYDRKRLRICFVDSCSKDKTMQMIESFRAEHGDEYEGVVVKVAQTNISEARNIAFREAVGTDYVFFLDSDILCPPDTINRLLASFRRDPAVAIASLPWDNRNSRRRAGLLYDAFAAPPGPHYAFKVGNGCNIVSMAAFAKVGGFNEKLRVHEDGEYCYRLRKKGFKIVCDFSSEGTHLRVYKLSPKYYLSFLRDSSETYRELIARGSVVHMAKVASSLALLVSFVLLLLAPGVGSGLAFLALFLFGIWLNAIKVVLDDGIHVKTAYRPIVGTIFTVGTVIISLFLLAGPLLPARKQ
ncbi:MAG TPA: glycosyltransferase [Nitrososphaerales archaeon]|nr:glycosyltransferase [Nitrososphaerales archaeon]